MPPQTVFAAPGTMGSFSPRELQQYTKVYNWTMAMQAFKATRTWRQVFAEYDQFPLAHLDRHPYTNWASIREKLHKKRKELGEWEDVHDTLVAAELLMAFANS